MEVNKTSVQMIILRNNLKILVETYFWFVISKNISLICGLDSFTAIKSCSSDDAIEIIKIY